MDRKKVKWLYDEIPGLVSEGVLSTESAEKLQKHYGDLDEANGLKTALAIFGVLGAVLISAGIILLLAKNWSDLSRTMRTILSFTPLVIGQILSGLVLWKRSESIAWREGAASFLFISIGAAISLIGQTYNIPGEMDTFLLVWMLLGIPLVYLMDVNLPGIFYLAGITVWSAVEQSQGGYALIYWALLILLLPQLYKKIKQNPYSNPSIFLNWAISIALCFAIGITLEKLLPGLWIIIYSGYFVVLYLSGKLWFKEETSFWQQPLQTVGRLGILAISFLITFEWPWKEIGVEHYRTRVGFHQYTGNFDYVIGAGFLLGAAYLIYTFIKKKEIYPLLFAASVILSIIGYITGSAIDTIIPVILYNIYMLVLGIGMVVKGIRIRHLGVSNGGMLILAILAVMRFFDSTLGFEQRGIAFILVGIGFLVTNILILKKRKGESQ